MLRYRRIAAARLRFGRPPSSSEAGRTMERPHAPVPPHRTQSSFWAHLGRLSRGLGACNYSKWATIAVRLFRRDEWRRDFTLLMMVHIRPHCASDQPKPIDEKMRKHWDSFAHIRRRLMGQLSLGRARFQRRLR